MARAYRGPYARPSSYPVPYATAAVWGTGISSVHYQYGEGPPLRMLGREGHIGASPVANLAPRDRDYQQPGHVSGDDPPEEVTWGYELDYSVDAFGMGANTSPSRVAPAFDEHMDDRPDWSQDTPHEVNRTSVGMQPSWGTGGAALRAFRGGAQRYRRNPNGPVTTEPTSSLPNETVSEGWLNKATSRTAYAHPSDPSQYEVQTSMRQRFGTRDNNRAQLRSTDAARSKIASRVEPMIEKVYSEGERLFDMFPFQQDQINRPFRYRTAGTGAPEWMEANAYNALTPVQRTPPADPAAGYPEVYESEDYGFTGEDTMYYG